MGTAEPLREPSAAVTQGPSRGSARAEMDKEDTQRMAEDLQLTVEDSQWMPEVTQRNLQVRCFPLDRR